MTHHERNAIKAKTGYGAIQDCQDRGMPSVIALDQISARQFDEAGAQFRGGNVDQYDQGDDPKAGKQRSFSDHFEGRLRCVQGLENQSADQGKGHSTSRMTLKQGDRKYERQGQQATGLIKPSSNALRLVLGKEIQAGQDAKAEKGTERIAVGKASGPVIKMGGFAKPESCLPIHCAGKGGKSDLKRAAGDQYLHCRIQQGLRAALCQKIAQRDYGNQQDQVCRQPHPGIWIQRNLWGAERVILRGPDRQGLQKAPDQYDCGNAPNADQIARCGNLLAGYANSKNAKTAHDRQNGDCPWARAAQKKRGQNDLGHQTKMRQPKHQALPTCFDYKVFSLAEFRAPVLAQSVDVA